MARSGSRTIEVKANTNGIMVSKANETKEKDKQRRDKLSGYFLDMSKLTFGATILSGVIPAFTEKSMVNIIYAVSGLVGTLVFYMVGRNILK